MQPQKSSDKQIEQIILLYRAEGWWLQGPFEPEHVERIITQSGLADRIGRENILSQYPLAIGRATRIASGGIEKRE